MSMGPLLYEISQIGDRTKSTMCLIHHSKKGVNRYDHVSPPSFGDLTGTGIQEWMRQWILVNRRSDYKSGRPHE
jgi:hypothetical protein